MKKLTVITPILDSGEALENYLQANFGSKFNIEHTFISSGPASVEGRFDSDLSVPDVLAKASAAESSGSDAIIINCMLDPGLLACRELVSIPVIGVCEVAMHVASMLGRKFGVISPVPGQSVMEHLAEGYGLGNDLVSFSSVDIPVLNISESEEVLAKALVKAAITMVRSNNLGVVVLGCTGFANCADLMREGLLKEELDVQVINPLPLAIYFSDALLQSGLTHSKLIYPSPAVKLRVGFDIQGH